MEEKKFVAAQGDVSRFCAENGLVVVEEYSGNILEYDGRSEILVVSGEWTIFEFYYCQYRLLKRGKLLVSADGYGDFGTVIEQFVKYLVARDLDLQRKNRKGGRQPYGFRWIDGARVEIPSEMAIARMIIQMREVEHKSYREIEHEVYAEGYRNQKGHKLTVSTIQVILKNRDLYTMGGNNG